MISRKRVAAAAGLLLLLLILAASVLLRPMFGNPWPNFVRWLVWSRSYKATVLAQAESGKDEFKHIEWDAWGWGGMDTTEYLVFDPTDSLSQAAKNHEAGTYSGIPCKVPLVKRLENQWYAVRFYTDKYWRANC